MSSKEKAGESLVSINVDKLAKEWVFKTNGHKWSNNDDTAGDNYGSYKEGFNKAMDLNKENAFTLSDLKECWECAKQSMEIYNRSKFVSAEFKLSEYSFEQFIKDLAITNKHYPTQK